MKKRTKVERFYIALGKLSTSKDELEELLYELQDWLEGLPENMQEGDRADRIRDAIETVEEAINNIEMTQNLGIDI